MYALESRMAKVLHPLLAPGTRGPAFDGTALPWNRIAAMIEAARWADSGWNRQPWRFVVGRVGDGTYRAIMESLQARNQLRAQGAGALVLAVAQTADSRGSRLIGTEYELGLAVSRLVLQARAIGWSTLQMGGFNRLALADILAVPTEFSPYVVVGVGRPTAGTHRPVSTRLPVTDLAFTGRWGRAVPTPATAR